MSLVAQDPDELIFAIRSCCIQVGKFDNIYCSSTKIGMLHAYEALIGCVLRGEFDRMGICIDLGLANAPDMWNEMLDLLFMELEVEAREGFDSIIKEVKSRHPFASEQQTVTLH